MLIAAASAVRSMSPQPRIVSSILGADTYEDRARLRLYQSLPEIRGFRLARFIGLPILKRYGAPYGIVSDKKINAVLDMSGYAYAERWGTSTVRTRLSQFTSWRKQGKKLIILPQAFGPFHTESMRSLVRRLIETADLVFARDKTSLEYLIDAGIEVTRVEVAPEFTQILQCAYDDELRNSFQDAIALVPNIQMVRQEGGVTWAEYFDFCIRVLKAICSSGFRPIIVQFSRSADKELVDSLCDTYPSVQVVRSRDPLCLKSAVGHCFGAICSRYHSLVCALCQGVPAMATAWSHKYKEYLRDYDVGECLISPALSEEDIRERILQFFLRDREVIVQRLRRHATKQVTEISKMWSKIAKVLGLSLVGPLEKAIDYAPAQLRDYECEDPKTV